MTMQLKDVFGFKSMYKHVRQVEKGEAQIGDVHEWGSGPHKKTATGWVKVSGKEAKGSQKQMKLTSQIKHIENRHHGGRHPKHSFNELTEIHRKMNATAGPKQAYNVGMVNETLRDARSALASGNTVAGRSMVTDAIIRMRGMARSMESGEKGHKMDDNNEEETSGAT